MRFTLIVVNRWLISWIAKPQGANALSQCPSFALEGDGDVDIVEVSVGFAVCSLLGLWIMCLGQLAGQGVKASGCPACWRLHRLARGGVWVLQVYVAGAAGL